MRFTNSPYEDLMKEPSCLSIPPGPLLAPAGTPCYKCPYWKGIRCVTCYRELLKNRRPPGR